MSKIQFEAVKELIANKNYAEARVVLQTINDPKARQWLEKLDTLDPQPPADLKERRRHQPLNFVIIILVAVVVSLLILNVMGTFSPSVQQALHFHETAVARHTDLPLTQVAADATDRAKPTDTPTMTPLPPATPVVEYTPISPRNYYVGSYGKFRSCPHFNCPEGMTYESGQPVMVVGLVIGDEDDDGRTLWLKVQLLDGAWLRDQYALMMLFYPSPPH